MNQKKNTKILMILIIIVLIILFIGGIAFAYLATDLFKSEKELFFKYVMQIGDSESGFVDTNLKQYFEKRKTNPYNNEGNFSVNIASENGQQQFENVNNFTISFSGQVDTVNSKETQNISLNYSDTVKFPINYKKIDNTIGLQTKYVGNKFIALEMDKLTNLTGSTDVDLEDYTDAVEKFQKMSKIELTDDEKSNIQNTYMEVLEQQLSKDKFSKVKESDTTGYKLSLTGEEFKNVIVQLLQTLENDQTTLDKINEYIKTIQNSAKISVSDIDDMIESINNEEWNNQNIEITVYSKKGTTNKITISTNEGSFNIEKTIENNKLQILFYYETKGENMGKVTFKATFEGLEAMQNIKEVYEFEIQYEDQNGILQRATKNKSETQVLEETEKVNLLMQEIKTDKMTENVSENITSTVIITKEDIEQYSGSDELYSGIVAKQMSDNEIQIEFVDTGHIFIINNEGKITSKPEQTSNDNDTTDSGGLIQYKYQYNNEVNFTDNVNIEEFTNENSMILTDYESEQVANFLNAVVQRITQVNKQQMEELGLQEDENPIIYMIPSFGIYSSSVATINSTEMSELEITTFNNKFEMYESTNLQGVTVKGLLSTISLNNESQDNDRQIKEINFNGEEYEATEQNITFIKEDIDTEKSYRVEFEKDQDTGIIYRAVINEK